MTTQQSEGAILKSRLKVSGKNLTEIAAILGISKKKLRRNLKEEILNKKFRRLIDEKEILIFKSGIIEMAEDLVDSMIKNIIYLKASDRISNMLLCELAAKIRQTSYSAEALQLEKNTGEEIDRLTDKYLKK